METTRSPFAAWLWDKLMGRFGPGMVQGKIAAEMKVTGSALSDWLNGNRLPDRRSIDKIARFFGLPYQSVQAVVAEAEHAGETERTPESIAEELLASVRRERERLMGDRSKVIMVPLVQSFGAAGEGAVAEVEHWPYVPTPEELGHDIFAMRVKGDCLSPLLHDGELVFVDRNVTPKIGSVVAVAFDGESLLRILQDGELVSLNGHPPIPIDDERIHLQGVVVFAGRRF